MLVCFICVLFWFAFVRLIDCCTMKLWKTSQNQHLFYLALGVLVWMVSFKLYIHRYIYEDTWLRKWGYFQSSITIVLHCNYIKIPMAGDIFQCMPYSYICMLFLLSGVVCILWLNSDNFSLSINLIQLLFYFATVLGTDFRMIYTCLILKLVLVLAIEIASSFSSVCRLYFFHGKNLKDFFCSCSINEDYYVVNGHFCLF